MEKPKGKKEEKKSTERIPDDKIVVPDWKPEESIRSDVFSFLVNVPKKIGGQNGSKQREEKQ